MVISLQLKMESEGFPGGAVVENPPANAGDMGSILVREDPTCCGATKLVCHNYWARVPQLLKPMRLEPVLHNERSHFNEKPAHRDEEWPPLTAN